MGFFLQLDAKISIFLDSDIPNFCVQLQNAIIETFAYKLTRPQTRENRQYSFQVQSPTRPRYRGSQGILAGSHASLAF
jgi:hypothetical protein